MKQPWARRRAATAGTSAGSGDWANHRANHGADPDVRTRADATLLAARSRNSSVVTLEVARSPADSCATVRIPRNVITAADPASVDPDSTQVISVARRA